MLNEHFLTPQRISIPGDCRPQWIIVRRKDGSQFGKGAFASEEDAQGWITDLTRDVAELVALMGVSNG